MPLICENKVEFLRKSKYLSRDEVEEILARLRKFYNVSYTEEIFSGEYKAFLLPKVKENFAIIRMFPLEKEKIPETDKETVKIGIIYIKESDIILHKDTEQIDKLFNYILSEKDDKLKRVNAKLMDKNEEKFLTKN